MGVIGTPRIQLIHYYPINDHPSLFPIPLTIDTHKKNTIVDHHGLRRLHKLPRRSSPTSRMLRHRRRPHGTGHVRGGGSTQPIRIQQRLRGAHAAGFTHPGASGSATEIARRRGERTEAAEDAGRVHYGDCGAEPAEWRVAVDAGMLRPGSTGAGYRSGEWSCDDGQ